MSSVDSFRFHSAYTYGLFMQPHYIIWFLVKHNWLKREEHIKVKDNFSLREYIQLNELLAMKPFLPRSLHCSANWACDTKILPKETSASAGHIIWNFLENLNYILKRFCIWKFPGRAPICYDLGSLNRCNRENLHKESVLTKVFETERTRRQHIEQRREGPQSNMTFSVGENFAIWGWETIRQGNKILMTIINHESETVKL